MIARSGRATREWRLETDFRIICPCQLHARSQNRWRRAARFAVRACAIVLTVPFAFAFDIPEKAKSLNVAALREQIRSRRVVAKLAPKSAAPAQPVAKESMAIFTTPAVREQFISTSAVDQVVTVDSFKEQYFRTHVPYGSIIYREARKNGIAPELVAAMVHTESDFRASLVS